MANSLNISVTLFNKESVELIIYEETANTLSSIDEIQACENGESPYQLLEGKEYEYILPENYSLEKSEIIKPSRIRANVGRICTNIYVGSLSIRIYKEECYVGDVFLEICSTKTDYRSDYRKMLKDITDKCTDLLMQQSELIKQNFTIDADCNPQTLYQRFAFVRSVIDSEDFNDAIQRIRISPVKKWKEAEMPCDICNVRRVNRNILKQIVAKQHRERLPDMHPFKENLESLPTHIDTLHRVETLDIPENRFVKHTLETFLQFCDIILQNPKACDRLKKDARIICEKLDVFLSYSVFKGISKLTVLPLNSPVLQRKEGYREILQTWFMFDMAAKLIWTGGDNVYKGGKRNVATLYEYWLFFKLIDVMEEIFHVKSKSMNELIKLTKNGLELSLKQGQTKVIKGIYESEQRRLHIELSYNRTFTSADCYPTGGSWTQIMRPDYTLSIWPEGIKRKCAEEQELIVHIHFDAKYRVEVYDSFIKNVDLKEEKREQAMGNYKRADLLKMHAYHDAIRRTAGAYILYPGKKGKEFHCFHEVLPGLGAFAISPSETGEETDGLKKFLSDVVSHFLNRASQREKFAFYTYNIFKDEGSVLKESLPELYNANRDLIPDDTYVLIGYYKNEEHLKWILNNHLYNTRTGSKKGTLYLTRENTSAKYLILHGMNDLLTSKIYKLDSKGPRVFAKEELVSLKYPNPSALYYIVYKIVGDVEEEFKDVEWDIKKLSKYRPYRESALPFSASLTELMQVKVSDKL